MKTQRLSAFRIPHSALLLALLSTLNSQLSTAHAQGTAFTYQGRLFDNTNAANGSYDLRFILYDGSTSLNVVAGPVAVGPVAVSNGLFTAVLDFGATPNPFTGLPRWLQVDSASNSVNPLYIPMSPRQQLTPAPYAIFATTASNLSGTLPTAQLSGSIPTTQLTGTVVNSQLASNTITISPGAGLSGGGVVPLGGSTSLAIPAGGVSNAMLANPSLTVSAGTGLAGGGAVALGGSTTLSNTGVLSVTGNADITATPANGNVILGDTATSANTANTIVKRDANGGFSAGTITGNGSGLTNVNALTVNGLNPANFWQTGGNNVAAGQFLGSTNNQPLELWAGGWRALRLEPGYGYPNVIGGSAGNSVSPVYAGIYGNTIGGGDGNAILATRFATIGGGQGNYIADGYWATVSGGNTNAANGSYSTVGGGLNNYAAGNSSTIPGGSGNFAQGQYSFAAGQRAKALNDGCFVWADSTPADYSSTANNQFLVRALGGIIMNAGGATGGINLQAGDYGTATLSGSNVTISGVSSGTVSLGAGTVSLRSGTSASLTVTPGTVTVEAPGLGGLTVNNDTAMYFGAQTRQMINLYGNSYGIGVQAYDMYFRIPSCGNETDFLWYSGGTHSDTAADPGPGGKVLMDLNGCSGHLIVAGDITGNFTFPSSRKAKEGFSPVDPGRVLEKVAGLPITEWNYTNNAAVKHIGPMAQDFYAAFNVGSDDKHIAVVDEGGVALAAIQGLNQKVDAENAALHAENADLKQRLERLERLMEHQTAGR